MSNTDDTQKPSEPKFTWTYSFHDGKERCFSRNEIEKHGTDTDIYWLPAWSDKGKRKKADIKFSTWVTADFDPPPGVWSKETGTESSPGALAKWRAAEQARLEALEPRLTLIVDTGRGFQAGYELTYSGDEQQIEAARYALAGDTGDKCWAYNAVYRLWGYRNSKTGELARIVRYEPDNKHALHELPAKEPPRTSYETDDITADVNATADVSMLKDATLAWIIEHGEDPLEKDRWPSRNEAVWWVINELLRQGIDDGTILGLILNRAHKISHRMYFIRQKGGSFVARRNPEAQARIELRNAKAKMEKSDEEMACDEDGKPYKNARNFRIGLGQLGVTVRYDEFADRFLVEGMDELGTELSDAIVNRVRILFQEKFKGWYPAKETAWDWAMDLAHRNRFHPVRDYLDSLEWDGVARLDRWLVGAGDAPDTELTHAVSSLVLMAAVARVFDPGMKFDQMLVLESSQGWEKSTALRALCPDPDWFTDALPLGVESKLVIEATRGKWIVEVAEMHGMKKADVERVKSQLSRQVDRARMSYGRASLDVPRQFVLFGTTNNDKYLKDQTGNRRFWPLAIGKPMDVSWLKANRDQLWAEAVVRVRRGDSLVLPKGLWQKAGEEQAKRAEDNPFFVRLEHYLGDRTGKVSPETVWTLLDIPPERRNGEKQELIYAAMAMIGWEPSRRRFKDSKAVIGWVKGTETQRLCEVHITNARSRGRDEEYELAADEADPRAVGKVVRGFVACH